MRKYLLMFFILIRLTTHGQNLSAYIATNTQELDINSKDFTGLGFLDTILKNKRIVFLGESSHGTEEFSKTKFQLIEYLHNKLGFNVILFESPMTSGSYLNLAKDTIPATNLVSNTLQYVWHTQTIVQIFDFIKDNRLYFGGFDPQFIASSYSNRLFSYAFNNSPEIEKELILLENKITQSYKTGITPTLKDSISAAYARLKSQMETKNLSPLQNWIAHIVTINTRYYNNLYKGNERDSCMENSLIWLAEKMYPTQKIIVWAHNAHIDKNPSSSVRFMGGIVSKHFGSQTYTVGLYMANGNTALNNRKIIKIKEPKKNSLETILLTRGFKTAFVETNNSSFDKKIKTLYWGKNTQKLNLSKSYDAVILINGVSPPNYLNE